MVRQSLAVLYQDEALIVIDKPEGVHTAPLAAGEPDTLQALVLSAFPEVAAVPGVKPTEHGLLHRLDRNTSGVVVVARTPAAFEALRKQFASGQVQKEYRAACVCRHGGPCEEKFTVTSRFAPAGPGRRTVRVVLPGEKSRKVLRETTGSHYTTVGHVLRRQGIRALLGATIRKGFRHQVRAHLSSAGWPIIGDELYGVAVEGDRQEPGESAERVFPYGEPASPGALNRMYLHAFAISLEHPLTGATLHVVSPLPETFNAVVSSERP